MIQPQMGGSRLRHTHKELLVLVHIVVLKKLNIVSVFALFGLFFGQIANAIAS